MAIQPYLFFNGRCEEALAFYQDKLGAKVEMMMRFRENPDAGAMEQVAVEIRAIMNPDGTVRSAEIVDAGRYNSDPRLRRHAEAALRAVKNPSCQPFTMLPANAYDEWSTIVFNLDPKSMF